jgi:hypothetical protein
MRITPLVLAAAAAASLLAAAPAHAARAHPGGTYGGSTAQEWPVTFTVAASGRSIIRAQIALERPCMAGPTRATPDSYSDLRVSRTGAFSSSFGPDPQKHDDGTSDEFTGSLSGRLDARRQRITGTWELKTVTKDAAGNVTDTCDSGPVKFTVRN